MNPPVARPQKRRNKRQKKPPVPLYAPSQWLTWLGIGFAWLLARLPLTVLRRLGLWLGHGAYWLAPARRRIAQTNIDLCFPDLDPAQRNALTRDCLQQVMLGTLEMAVAWLNPKRNVRPYCTLSGVEHLKAAQARNRGVVLVGGHYAVMTSSPRACRTWAVSI